MLALLDIKAAARLLAISPWTVRLYLRQGKLRAVRIGRRVLIEPAELERFVEEAKNASQATLEPANATARQA